MTGVQKEAGSCRDKRKSNEESLKEAGRRRKRESTRTSISGGGGEKGKIVYRTNTRVEIGTLGGLLMN